MKDEILKEIERIETLIMIYSERDQVRTSQLEMRLFDYNMRLLDIMTNETTKAA